MKIIISSDSVNKLYNKNYNLVKLIFEDQFFLVNFNIIFNINFII